MAALGADVRTAALAPLLVTGRVVACLPRDAERLRRWRARPLAGEADRPHGDSAGHARRRCFTRGGRRRPRDPRQPGWTSQAWVSAAGVALAAGTTQLVVGTRGLLGEGWDAPALNVLVDLTTVAADISVRQMRGRALRLDPADGDKVASNWDVVCVAADLARGTADYERFVRRHAHLQRAVRGRVDRDGRLSRAPDAVAVPAAARPRPRRGSTRQRSRVPPTTSAHGRAGGSASRTSARTCRCLLVRRAVARSPGATGRPHVRSRRRGAPAGARREPDRARPAIAPPRPRGPLLAFRLRAARDAYPEVAPLDRIAQAIVGAYVSLGEISATAGASLALTPRAGGTIRCALPAGTSAENAKLLDALDEALTPGARPAVRHQPPGVPGVAELDRRRTPSPHLPAHARRRLAPRPQRPRLPQGARRGLPRRLAHPRRPRRAALRRPRGRRRPRPRSPPPPPRPPTTSRASASSGTNPQQTPPPPPQGGSDPAHTHKGV